MASASSDADKNVNFLYRTMVERDPKKRRVKPVEQHMLQLDFGDLDDSSDDSDFKVPDNEDDDDSDSGGSEDNGKKGKDEEDSKDEEDGDDEDESDNSSGRTKTKGVSLFELIERAKQKQAQARQRVSQISVADDDFHASQLRVLICSVCLGDIRCEENDEIVECDGCGVSVHEGCYGITDAETVGSTVSSCSTEPWFCDACKAGKIKPVCELCPNYGGIFKETDVGKWVHLVCALYVPGVAFGDVDKLSPVTLFEMPYSKWGAKICSLCEDERFSRTGVCICCDAGMCKSYFHVTCAQREGLLSEALPEEAKEIADPFFAYCKLHADKGISRSKRRNWLALQSHVRASRDKDTDEKKKQTEEQGRIDRKLNGHRAKYNENKSTRPVPWVPTQKMPRLLTSSPSACRKLIKKAELMGINTQSMQVQQSNADNVVDIRKKWHVPPAFNVEFISYYLDRNERMISMRTRLDEMLVLNVKLQDEEVTMREKYEKALVELDQIKKSNVEMREQGLQYWKIISGLGPRKFNVPEILRPKKSQKPGTKHGRRDSESHSVALNQCGICKKTRDQHLLAKCDTCRLYYHLGCLDPPLTRLPKKTKLQGWQCSECDKTDEEEKEDDVDPNAPRKLREHIKEPVKFTPPVDSPSTKKTKIQKRKVMELRQGPKRKTEDADPPKSPVTRKEKRIKVEDETEAQTVDTDDQSSTLSPDGTVGSNSGRRRGTSGRDVRTSCCRCAQPGDNSSLVRCDECKKCYHFGCLKPPVKKSPKQRGYTWHCEDCDTTDDEAEDEDDDDEDEEEEDEEEDEESANQKLQKQAVKNLKNVSVKLEKK